MDWNCYSRMQGIFASHPEYLASKAVQDTLRYANSDPAYSMCETYGIKDEASLLDFINPPEPILRPPPPESYAHPPPTTPETPRSMEDTVKVLIIAAIVLMIVLRR